MKQFTHLTELQILNYACDRIMDLFYREKDLYERHQSELNKKRYLKRQAQYVEIRNEIIRLEKLQNSK